MSSGCRLASTPIVLRSATASRGGRPGSCSPSPGSWIWPDGGWRRSHDPEGVQPFRLFLPHPYVRHRGPPWTVPGPVHELLHVVPGSFEDGPDPAGHAMLVGYLAARVAEEHTLNTAGDEYPVADHGTDVTGTVRVEICGPLGINRLQCVTGAFRPDTSA